MKREWKPGDVAMLGSHVSLCVQYDPLGCPGAHQYDGDHWHRAAGDWVINGGGIEPRRLAVIDPEDREAVERLLRGYAGWTSTADGIENHPRYVDDMQAALREFANPTPPKPEEPLGLGAVVEDAEGNRWVLYTHPDGTSPWCDGSTSCDWDEIPAVRVLSPGYTEGAAS